MHKSQVSRSYIHVKYYTWCPKGTFHLKSNHHLWTVPSFLSTLTTQMALHICWTNIVITLPAAPHITTMANAVLCFRNHHGPHDDLLGSGGSQGSAQSALPYSSGLLCVHIIYIHFLNSCSGKSGLDFSNCLARCFICFNCYFSVKLNYFIKHQLLRNLLVLFSL